MNTIIHMNHAFGHLELETTPAAPSREPVYYWHVYRRSVNGRRWLKVAGFFETEVDMADLYRKFYGSASYSLRCLLRY